MILDRKDQVAFQIEKKKKIKDLDKWSRAVREEEKIAISNYALEHNNEEMNIINDTVRKYHNKQI